MICYWKAAKLGFKEETMTSLSKDGYPSKDGSGLYF